MENNKFEKRMELLKKSYERIPSSFNSEEVLRKIDEESANSMKDEISFNKNNRFKRNLTVWAVSIASVFLFGFITAFFMFEQQDVTVEMAGQEITQEYIVGLKKEYAIEREKRREILKMEEQKFGSLVFVSEADSLISHLTNNRYIKVLNSLENGRERLDSGLENALTALKLPSEMVKEVVENPLTNDEQGSITFLASYRSKVQSLIAVYDEILSENREAVKEYEVSPTVDKAEVMMLSRNKFPEQLQNSIGTMQEQSIHLYTVGKTDEIATRYYDSNLHKDMKYNFHENTLGYVDMMAKEPYLFGSTLNYSLEEMAWIIWEMEKTLLNVEKDSALYPVMESYYVMIFNTIIDGAKSSKASDEQGRIHDEYRNLLKSIVSGEATPLTYIVKPIITEMEASDWRQSKSLDALAYYDLIDALEFARAGQLEKIMYGERPDIGDHSISLPNLVFEKEIISLYYEFKKSYDKSIFKGKSPIYVVGVFDYANDMEDPETMFHLFHENVGNESGEEFNVEWYTANWRKGFSLFKEADQVVFSEDTMNRNDNTFFAPIQILKNEEVIKGVNLLLDENKIWHLHEALLEPLPSYEIELETDIDEHFMDNVRYVYKSFSKSKDQTVLRGTRAVTIAGVYYYAGEVGDYDTQYELYFQGENHHSVERDVYIKEAAMSQAIKFEDEYKSITFKADEQQDIDGNWNGLATLIRNPEKDTVSDNKHFFPMKWTENGWRVNFMPLQ